MDSQNVIHRCGNPSLSSIRFPLNDVRHLSFYRNISCICAIIAACFSIKEVAMTRTRELLRFMEGRGGIARSADLLGAGFSAGLVASLERKGDIERETRGVYVTAGTILDDFARIQLRWGRCVFSHGSALYLDGLSDRLPIRLEVTVPREYNAAGLVAGNPTLVVHRANRTAYPLGMTEAQSMSGVKVKAYDMERCICDLLSARRKDDADIQLFAGALDGYFKRDDKDIGKLGRYAKALGVGDELHRYTEVLL